MPTLIRPTDLIQPPLSGLIPRRWPHVPTRGVQSILARLTERLHRFWTVYQTKEELSRLSDRALSDIGTCREDIASVARYGRNGGLVRYDEIGMLLALDDGDLTDLGLDRGDLQAYRDGRLKFLSRRSMPSGTPVDRNRRTQAELAALTARERLELDVTSGNLAWAEAAHKARHGETERNDTDLSARATRHGKVGSGFVDTP
jgi:uncharacterized protein YjiS (DUF1127 family)